jgi:hypothetical protein
VHALCTKASVSALCVCVPWASVICISRAFYNLSGAAACAVCIRGAAARWLSPSNWLSAASRMFVWSACVFVCEKCHTHKNERNPLSRRSIFPTHTLFQTQHSTLRKLFRLFYVNEKICCCTRRVQGLFKALQLLIIKSSKNLLEPRAQLISFGLKCSHYQRIAYLCKFIGLVLEYMIILKSSLPSLLTYKPVGDCFWYWFQMFQTIYYVILQSYTTRCTNKSPLSTQLSIFNRNLNLPSNNIMVQIIPMNNFSNWCMRLINCPFLQICWCKLHNLYSRHPNAPFRDLSGSHIKTAHLKIQCISTNLKKMIMKKPVTCPTHAYSKFRSSAVKISWGQKRAHLRQ